MRILIVEDDLMLGSSIKSALENENNVADWVTDSDDCEAALKTAQFEVIILDINLPNKSGLEILKSLRAQKNYTPVLILTALGSVEQKVAGLDSGADDYLTKPFNLDELLARIRSIVRRSNGIAELILTHKNISLNPAKHVVTVDEKVVEVSPKEFAILKLLLENNEKVVSKARLENLLYSWEESLESNALEVHIHNLRKKIGAQNIKTIRGVGYLLA